MSVLMDHGDPAQQLMARCEQQRHVKDSGVDSALDAIHQHSATSARFVQLLARLARYKMDVAGADETRGRAICAAVEARRATLEVGFAALELRQPLLTRVVGYDSDSEGLLGRLADEARAALTRLEAAEGAMKTPDELPRLHEDAWRGHALARDQARQELVHFAALHLEGLRAKQRCLERALSDVSEGDVALPELPSVGDAQSSQALDADGERASPLLAACADVVKCVHELGQVCGGEARAQAIAIAGRIAEEHRGRRRMLHAAVQAGAAELRAARQAYEAPAALHGRRVRAESLLATLEELQAEFRAVLLEERQARRALEDLEFNAAPGDSAVERSRAKHEEISIRFAALSRRRDGVVAEVAALSAVPVQTRGGILGDDVAVPLDFAELPVRAQRIVQPFQAYEVLDTAGRARFDVELLLRRAGLLAFDRSYASYSELMVVTSSKPNVKRATLRGLAQGTAPKILKEYGVNEFRRIKRSVATASRLHHPGIVPVECAFLERGDVVVVQSPCYVGGNMRQWCRGKDAEVKLRAAQRVAEAVRFLHSHGVLHRDLKPENIVFDGDGPTAAPALCDFDLSVNTHETMASTLMRGTPLYLAPDPTPSSASDVFALGVTLLDVLFCDGDEERLREMVVGSGRVNSADLADLERVRAALGRRSDRTELAALVRSMLAPQSTERPEASAVAETLSELLLVSTCCVCHCPEPRDKGLECDGVTRHFACDECFSAHVSRLEALCEAEGGFVKCCASDWGCAARFTIQAAAQHATPLAFETLQRHADDLKHVALQGEFERWKERFEAERAARSEQERRALVARQHIEELMDLRCPKCSRVFGQFTGCAALTCAYAGCLAHFCAFCLADCGSDAHPHVRKCRLNPRQNEHFVSEAEWARVVDEERRRKLQAYWATLEAEVKEALAADASVRQIFRDLRLEGHVGAAAFAQQVAQLRGMGFTDERAMRRALSEVGGDVAAALDLL